MGPAGEPPKSPQSGQMILTFKYLPGPESWSQVNTVPVHIKNTLVTHFLFFPLFQSLKI